MRLELLVLGLAVAMMVVVIEFVRRRKLLENFAILWLGVGCGGLALGIGRPAIDWLARRLGVQYGTSLIFSFSVLFLVALCMYLSLQVSRLAERVETLAEEIAFLRGVRMPPGDDKAVGSPDEADH
ncbi:MAG: DUF2304 domain-containing protein [Acidimicrobiales bacterium]